MKNVTITLDDTIATRARVEAARRGKSLSKFVRELIEREIGRDDTSGLQAIEEFLKGPGYPGISRNWRGREELYAERENELLRRYQRADLRSRPGPLR
jgi:ribbon-helix-helix CopG family protein